eukprot:Polyplicarium_translucidae@DN2779_c0_g2_i3.p1
MRPTEFPILVYVKDVEHLSALVRHGLENACAPNMPKNNVEVASLHELLQRLSPQELEEFRPADGLRPPDSEPDNESESQEEEGGDCLYSTFNWIVRILVVVAGAGLVFYLGLKFGTGRTRVFPLVESQLHPETGWDFSYTHSIMTLRLNLTLAMMTPLLSTKLTLDRVQLLMYLLEWSNPVEDLAFHRESATKIYGITTNEEFEKDAGLVYTQVNDYGFPNDWYFPRWSVHMAHQVEDGKPLDLGTVYGLGSMAYPSFDDLEIWSPIDDKIFDFIDSECYSQGVVALGLVFDAARVKSWIFSSRTAAVQLEPIPMLCPTV